MGREPGLLSLLYKGGYGLIKHLDGRLVRPVTMLSVDFRLIRPYDGVADSHNVNLADTHTFTMETAFNLDARSNRRAE